MLLDLPLDGPRSSASATSSVETVSPGADTATVVGAFAAVLTVQTGRNDPIAVGINLDDDDVGVVLFEDLPLSLRGRTEKAAAAIKAKKALVFQDLKDEGFFHHPSYQVAVGKTTSQRSTMALDLELLLGDDKLTLRYRQDVIRERSALRLLNQIVRASMEDDWREPNLNAADERALLVDANATKKPFEDKCIHDLFWTKDPTTVFALYEGEGTTYGGMMAEIAKAAQKFGPLTPDEPVALLLRREPSMIVAIFGVLVAGGCYVPLEPEDYPDDRIQQIVDDANCMLIVTQRRFKLHFHDVLPERRIVCVDDLDDDDDDDSDADDDVVRYRSYPHDPSLGPSLLFKATNKATTPKHLVYIFYTSGTSGKPKGVLVEHRGLVRRIAWFQRRTELGPGDAILVKTTYTFGISEWEIFWTPTTGAKMVIARHDGHKITSYLAQLIKEVNVACFVPSALGALGDHIHEEEAESYDGMRLIVACGEALKQDVVRSCFTAFPSTKLSNVYGPTEADMTYFDLDPAYEGPIPIGRPMDNVVVYLLDDRGRAVPPGARGELHFGAPAPARGYLGLPELTEKAWITNPYAGIAVDDVPKCEILYKTGDLARWLPTGELAFCGRVSGGQIKLRGYRIELDDVAAALQSHPRVKKAVATLVDPDKPTARLVGYVVAAAGSSSAGDDAIVDPSELALDALDYAKEILPGYAVPGTVVELRSLPTTSRGKLDRSRLPVPASSTGDGADFVECATPTERAIEGVWQSVLGLDASTPISSTADFVELGGNSLLAGRATTKLRHVLDVQLQGTAMYRFPTIADLAVHADDLLKTSETTKKEAPKTPKKKDYQGYSSTAPGAVVGQLLVYLLSLVISDLGPTIPPLILLFWAALTKGIVFAAFVVSPLTSLIIPVILGGLAVLANALFAPKPKKKTGFALRRIKLWSRAYLGWLLAKNVTAVASQSVASLFGGTSIELFFYRCCGAKIGEDVIFESGADIEDPKFLTFESGTRVGRHARVSGHFVENGEVVLARTKMEHGSRTQPRSCLAAGATLTSGASLGALASGGGGAAFSREDLDDDDNAVEKDDGLEKKVDFGLHYFFGVPVILGCESLAVLAALKIVFTLYNWFLKTTSQSWMMYAVLAWMFTLCETEIFFGMCVVVKKVIVGTFVEGDEIGESAVRRWLWDRLVHHAFFEGATAPYVNSELLAMKYRLLGARIGSHVNMDCVDVVEHDLVEIGNEVVFGSSVVLLPYVATAKGRSLKIRIENSANVLDHTVLLPGCVVEQGAVTGTCTIGPRNFHFPAGTVSTGRVGGAPITLKFQGDVEKGTSKLPAKDKAKVLAALKKHRDPKIFGLFNLFVVLCAGVLEPLEVLRGLAPVYACAEIKFEFLSFVGLHFYFLTVCVVYAYAVGSSWVFILVAFLSAETIAVLMVIALKQLVIGRYDAVDAEYYSDLHIRWCLMMSLASSVDHVLDAMQGTFLAPMFFRSMGAKVGTNCCLFYGSALEFDLLSIGDNVSTGDGADLTAHTVENMVVKFSTVIIGSDCAMAANTVCMPGATMEPGSTLLEGSQVLKGETVGAGEVWRGLPATRIGDEHRDVEASVDERAGILGISSTAFLDLKARADRGNPGALKIFTQLNRMRSRLLARAGTVSDDVPGPLPKENGLRPIPPPRLRPPHLRPYRIAQTLDVSVDDARALIRKWRRRDVVASQKINDVKYRLFAAFAGIEDDSKAIFDRADAGDPDAAALVRSYRHAYHGPPGARGRGGPGGGPGGPGRGRGGRGRGGSGFRGGRFPGRGGFHPPPPPGDNDVRPHHPPMVWRDAALVLAGALVVSMAVNLHFLLGHNLPPTLS